MQELYNRPPEKSRRLYAGVEASKLGRGWCQLYSKSFNCSRNTILRGIKELGEEDVLKNRNRETGGGRCPMLLKTPDINATFLPILKEYTEGDPPMDERVKWTNLSCSGITNFLAKKGFKVSRNIVRKLLKNMDTSNVKH